MLPLLALRAGLVHMQDLLGFTFGGFYLPANVEKCKGPQSLQVIPRPTMSAASNCTDCSINHDTCIISRSCEL